MPSYDDEEDHSTSLALAFHNYAAASPSPWANRTNAVFTAEQDYENALADAVRDQRVTDATDDKTHAVSRINAEHALMAALADSEVDRRVDEQRHGGATLKRKVKPCAIEVRKSD